MPTRPSGRTTTVRVILFVLTVWGVLVMAAVTLFILGKDQNPDHRAVIRMALGLILVWCVLGGLVMAAFRERFVTEARRIPLGWRTRFVALCIVFALLEEAVTTSLSNLAPWLGGVTDAARITASKNYFVVVLQNSVIAFVPLFLCWGWMLSRVRFRPLEVLLLFGITGVLAETLSFGPQNLLACGVWVWVYGLMVYLPAWTVPQDRPGAEPRWWHWPVAVFLPIVFIIPLVVWLILTGTLRAGRWLNGRWSGPTNPTEPLT